MTPARIGRQCRRLGPQRRRRMHRASALPRSAGTCRSAIVSTRAARTRGTTIVAARSVTTLAGRSAGTSIDRLARTHRTGINRTPRNRAGRTRRHAWPRRGRSTWRRRTRRQSRHHIGARRNNGSSLRLPCQIRLGRRTQRLSGRLRRARRARTDRLRPQRRRNARQAGRGGPRRARSYHRRWSFRGIAHTGRHRLPGS